MEEIREIARKISVLKDGKLVGTVDSSVPTQDIIRMMVGRNLEAGSEESCFSNDIKLEVRNLTGEGFSNISFQLRRGEILGFAGLEGSALKDNSLFCSSRLITGPDKRHCSQVISTCCFTAPPCNPFSVVLKKVPVL